MTQGGSLTLERMTGELKATGIGTGDVVLVHSSFKSLGDVEGGPEAVIDAFLNVLTPRGLFIVPTLTATFADRMSQSMRLYSYDPRETPSRVGVITDKAWRRPGAFRSHHPTHSLSAIGDRAEEFVSGHSLHTFDRRGPYGRYVRWDATVVFLGTGLNCNTTLHVAEDWAELPYMEQDVAVKVKNADGSTRIEKVTMSPNGHRNFYVPDEESPIVKEFYDRGMVREAAFGPTQVRLIRAQDIINHTLAIFYDDPAFLLCGNETCEFCVRGREMCREQQPRIRRTIDRLAEEGWYQPPGR